MYATIGLLVSLGVIGGYVYHTTHSVISTLNAVAWSFLFYMLSKIPYLLWRVPRRLRYQPPRMDVPHTVDRERLPSFKDEAIAAHERVVADLLRAILKKIQHAADEAAIHAFVQAKLMTLRRQTHERYSGITSQINVIGFEGIIGTLIGLVVFMAQATVLFQIPSVTSESQSVEAVGAFIENLHTIDLWTVSTAFFTSIIGWCVKAWVGAWADERMGEEAASITAVESWIQDEVLAKMTLPAQITTILKFADTKELHQPLVDAVGELREVARQLQGAVERSSQIVDASSELAQKVQGDLVPAAVEAMHRLAGLASIDSWRVDVAYVDGGMQLTPRARKGNGGGDA